MPARKSERWPTYHLLSLIVPEPRFKACCDRMSRRVKVLRGILTGRTVTTADVSALGAVADTLFKRFSTNFYGEISPVHFLWGSVDLAVTHVSGRLAFRRGIETHGGTGKSLAKGVLQDLAAAALSIKPGRSAEGIQVRGGLLSRERTPGIRAAPFH
jgi:hypothetical protein